MIHTHFYRKTWLQRHRKPIQFGNIIIRQKHIVKVYIYILVICIDIAVIFIDTLININIINFYVIFYMYKNVIKNYISLNNITMY